MKIEQLYTNCLAQGAYYIESNGEAAVIDPLRETNQYVELANKRNARIKYVLETHFHADFVSGHLDLAKKSGAQIVYGPNAETNFEIHQAHDEEILSLGELKIKVLHTPGHTMESTTYLLIDKDDKQIAVFTGDTLFIGDVGRPDLAQKGTLTQEDLASYLYDSLHNKIMTLDDNVIVYPGHGAGSACGKKMSDETQSTIGLQKKTNYALQNISREQFIKEVTDGLTPPPSYFPDNVRLNKEGYSNFDELLTKSKKALSKIEIEALTKDKSTLILDVRSPKEFAQKHIKGSIHIGLDGKFAPWVGALIRNVHTPLIIVSPEDRIEETITRLSRVGFDNILGYVDGGVQSWENQGGAIDTLTLIDANEFGNIYNQEMTIIDVRKPSEFAINHLPNAQNAPLDYIHDNYTKIPQDKHIYLHCLGGYRATITSSILKNYGYKDITVVYDDFQNIYNAINHKEVLA